MGEEVYSDALLTIERRGSGCIRMRLITKTGLWSVHKAARCAYCVCGTTHFWAIELKVGAGAFVCVFESWDVCFGAAASEIARYSAL